MTQNEYYKPIDLMFLAKHRDKFNTKYHHILNIDIIKYIRIRMIMHPEASKYETEQALATKISDRVLRLPNNNTDKQKKHISLLNLVACLLFIKDLNKTDYNYMKNYYLKNKYVVG